MLWGTDNDSTIPRVGLVCHKFWVSTTLVDLEAYLVERGQAIYPAEPHQLFFLFELGWETMCFLGEQCFFQDLSAPSQVVFQS